ncbi:MAG TPA: hypothetical protein VF114_09190 [Candidatus Limnocylindria bacterium]
MTELVLVEFEPAPAADDLLSAACTLGPGAMKARLADWAALRDRSSEMRVDGQAAVLVLAADEPLDAVTRLIDLESACCSFYHFSLRVAGDRRELEVDAGPSGGPAVAALLSLGP